MPIDTVAVANDEEMEALLSAHVRSERVSILVDLVRVTRLVPAGCRKGELSDGVEALVTANWNVLLDLLRRMQHIVDSLTCHFRRFTTSVRRLLLDLIAVCRSPVVGGCRGLLLVALIDAVDGRYALLECPVQRVGHHVLLPTVLVPLTG